MASCQHLVRPNNTDRCPLMFGGNCSVKDARQLLENKKTPNNVIRPISDIRPLARSSVQDS